MLQLIPTVCIYLVLISVSHSNVAINPYSLHLSGIDFGFSSSVTTIYVAELDTENQIVRIVIGEEYDKTTPSVIADRIFKLHTEIPNLLVFVDGSNRGAVNQVNQSLVNPLIGKRQKTYL